MKKLARVYFSMLMLSSFMVSRAFCAATAQLDLLVRDAWKNSPSLAAQEEQLSITDGDRWRRFILSEPQFQYSDTDDHTAHSFGISITTAFPGKAFALSRLDSSKARAQKLEYHAKKYDLAKTIGQAYLDCAAARETYQLQQVTAQDADTLYQSLKATYENGHSTQAEKIGSELQSRQAKLDLVTAQDKAEVLCKKMNQVLRVTGMNEIDQEKTQLTLPDDWNQPFIFELGGETADQARAAASMDSAQANVSTAWWSQVPDLTFGVTRNQYLYLPGSPSGKQWATNVSVSITVPILFPFHESIEVKRAKNQGEMDRNAAEIGKVSADSDQADGAREYRRSASRLKELREKDLPLAEALVESTYSAYQIGKLGYSELILSRKTLTDIRNQDIQLRLSVLNAHLKCLNRCEEKI